MNDKWKSFWNQHVEKANKDPFIQVGRTLNGQPMSQEMFKKFATYIIELLKLKPDYLVLDLCCGNGLLSEEMAPHCLKVIGVDFSEKLIEEQKWRTSKNIESKVSDVMDISFDLDSFHVIVMAAALQHFSQRQTIELFKKMHSWLKPGGSMLLTDIPDFRNMWNFYNSFEREDSYFKCTMNNTSILGTWYDRIWLEKLARHVGFSNCQALDQPNDYWYSYYRFDLLCQKSGIILDLSI